MSFKDWIGSYERYYDGLFGTTKPQEEKMSDLKWGYPEVDRYGKVRIGCETKTTGEWLEMLRPREGIRSCSEADYLVYRAIIQRWHDQHKAAEKAKAEKPKQFKAGDYVVGFTGDCPEEDMYLVEGFSGLDVITIDVEGEKDHYRFTGDERPATDPEIESFRKELAENLGLRYDTWVEYKGKEYRIADHDLKAGKPDGDILLKGAGFNVKIQDWPTLKVVEPKEQVKEVKDSTVDVKKFVREMIKGLEEVKSIGQPKQDGPTDKQVLEACYEAKEKVEKCDGNYMKYNWCSSSCSLCILYKEFVGSECGGKCPLSRTSDLNDHPTDPPCAPFHPASNESLTPLTEAVDKAIAELEGKVKPKFEVGQWYKTALDIKYRYSHWFGNHVFYDADSNKCVFTPQDFEDELIPCDPPDDKLKFKVGQPVKHKKYGKGAIDRPNHEFTEDHTRYVVYFPGFKDGGCYWCDAKDLSPCDPPPSTCPDYEPKAKPSDTPIMDILKKDVKPDHPNYKEIIEIGERMDKILGKVSK